MGNIEHPDTSYRKTRICIAGLALVLHAIRDSYGLYCLKSDVCQAKSIGKRGKSRASQG